MGRDSEVAGASDSREEPGAASGLASTGAFVPGTDVRVPGAAGGPLSDLAFAVKDLFDVAGEPTGGGNPDWSRTNPVPERHAALVERLLRAGATVAGKTITDEISLGILGENAFYGTPRNAAAPGFVPGGSSSGSAAAVAAGAVDFRARLATPAARCGFPASFCGLYGLRPTHGRIDLAGLMPQAPSFDTAGWFARDADTFLRVSEAALGEAAPQGPRGLAGAADRRARRLRLRRARGRRGVARSPDTDSPAWQRATVEMTLAPQGLSVWARAQRTLQIPEALETFRDWIERTNPRLSMRVAQSLVNAAAVTPAERQWAELMRHEVRSRLRDLLDEGDGRLSTHHPVPGPTGRPPALPAQRDWPPVELAHLGGRALRSAAALRSGRPRRRAPGGTLAHRSLPERSSCSPRSPGLSPGLSPKLTPGPRRTRR